MCAKSCRAVISISAAIDRLRQHEAAKEGMAHASHISQIAESCGRIQPKRDPTDERSSPDFGFGIERFPQTQRFIFALASANLTFVVLNSLQAAEPHQVVVEESQF